MKISIIIIKRSILKMKWIYYFALLYLLSSSTCRKERDCSRDKLLIKNNSSISVNWIRDDSPDSDTIWINNGDYPDASWRLILPNSTYELGAGREQCWENVHNGGYQYYFIFNHDTVQSIGWEGISGTNRGLLKRVKLDSTYLSDNNLTLSYP